MNAHTHPSPHRYKGNLFILIKKSQLPKLQQLHELNKKTRSANPKNPQIDINITKPQTEKGLLTGPLPRYVNPIKPKIYRKNSQVQIVQDFNDISIEEQPKLAAEKQKQYLINISECHNNESLKQQQSLHKQQNFYAFNPQQMTDFSPQIIEKYQNFKAFFQYILDFKLMKQNSYNPHQPQTTISNNQQTTKITSKRLPNSLAANFTEKQTQKNISKSHQVKSQGQENKETKNRELQTSQISLVDVRFSSASIDDFTPMFRNQRKGLNLSLSPEIKKSKKVYFDFQNPCFSQPDCILQETNPIVQSQNNFNIINRTSSRIVTFQELKKRIQNSQEQNIVTHHGYFCDECKVDPIVGKRYRCIQCDEYDLCEPCYKKQCEKYGRILKKYEHSKEQSHQNEKKPKLNSNHLFQPRALLKKQISDIAEQEILSQNYSSSEENLHSSSSKEIQQVQKDHVHLMEEVHKPKQIHHLNLQKILRQTNRCSLRSINEKNMKKERQNFLTHKKSALNASSHRQKLLSSIKMNKSRLAFSERTIPLNFTQRSHHKILQSKRRQIQNIRNSTQSISNHMK